MSEAGNMVNELKAQLALQEIELEKRNKRQIILLRWLKLKPRMFHAKAAVDEEKLKLSKLSTKQIILS